MLGEFEDALRGDAGDAVFAIGEPAFLTGGEAAEAALALGAVVLGAVPVVVGVGIVIDLAFGPGIGLVEGAVEGFAAVGGEGFEDAGGQLIVGVGYGGMGLPVGAVPADEAGVGGVYVEQMFRGGGSTEVARVMAGSARPLLVVRAAANAISPNRVMPATKTLSINGTPWGAGWDVG